MESVLVVSNTSIKQYYWRERQVNIFYRTGRPIYNIDSNSQHLRSHNNPTYYRDINSESWRPIFRIKQ